MGVSDYGTMPTKKTFLTAKKLFLVWENEKQSSILKSSMSKINFEISQKI